MVDLLLNESVVRTAMVSLALITPVAGVGVFLLTRRLPLSVMLGASGPVLLLAWFVYNAIADHFGLDSLRGLGVNFALFTVVGVVVGLVCRRLLAPPMVSPDEPNP